MSPDVLAIFNEAQKNIMELNRSRLSALEEAEGAKQRVSQLEAELQQSRAEAQATAREVQQVQSELQKAKKELQQVQNELQQLRPAAAGDEAAGTSGGGKSGLAQAGTITIIYETGWKDAFVHHCADNNGWTQSPGDRMQPGEGRWAKARVLALHAREVEFVVNNGGQEWDTNNPYGRDDKPNNYRASEPGVYLLEAGKLHRLD